MGQCILCTHAHVLKKGMTMDVGIESRYMRKFHETYVAGR